ncbi:MAG: HDOD domain-containing protein [Pirellulaceae bacterium]|nr:HDOD domain-containing protein [Pirellulaceae bacterium]
MKRVLFIDDEPEILRGLERSMDLVADDWEMDFTGSGEEALEMMAEEDFDAVVTDMRMPGMNGSEVVNILQAEHPNVARIVLSGQSSREATFRSVHPMHLYVSKPCDSEELYSAIQRAITLQRLLNNSELKVFVNGLDRLPSKPELYDRVHEEIMSEEPSIRNVGEIVQQDAAMSAKILQLANSAQYGLRRTVRDAVQASVVLGMETVRDLVLAAGVAMQYSGVEAGGFCLNEYCDRSLAVAKLAKGIAAKQGADKATCDESFTAGLLHKIGQLILVDCEPEQYSRLLLDHANDLEALLLAETEAFGADHLSVGAYALGQWGLPQVVIEAVGFSHKPDKLRHQGMLPVTAVHVATILEKRGQEADEFVDQDYLSAVGLDKQLDEWKQLCDEAA